jgi:hypothetical protein
MIHLKPITEHDRELRFGLDTIGLMNSSRAWIIIRSAAAIASCDAWARRSNRAREYDHGTVQSFNRPR